MSVFSKFKSLFKSKNNVASKIKDTNEKKQFVVQEKFDAGLKKSSSILSQQVESIVKKHKRVDDDLIEAIEEMLITFDVGSSSTKKILDSIVDEIKLQNIVDTELVKEIIIDKLFVYYIQDTNVNTSLNVKKNQMNVILVCGVNGVGKTTSIAKLGNMYKQLGYSVCFVAGDTFRAGAIEQLKQWADKIGVPIFTPQKESQDPASVIYAGVEYAKKNGTEIVLCDTSGRLQNKTNLMNELKKINNIIKKFDETQPCEKLLVLDATTGQNGIKQANAFNEVTDLTGIILTKMDSTSKGGIVLAIKDVFNLPVKFIGLGEALGDIQEFDLEMFIHGLVEDLNV